jgi:hypothetical protein
LYEQQVISDGSALQERERGGGVSGERFARKPIKSERNNAIPFNGTGQASEIPMEGGRRRNDMAISQQKLLGRIV